MSTNGVWMSDHDGPHWCLWAHAWKSSWAYRTGGGGRENSSVNAPFFKKKKTPTTQRQVRYQQELNSGNPLRDRMPSESAAVLKYRSGRPALAQYHPLPTGTPDRALALLQDGQHGLPPHCACALYLCSSSSSVRFSWPLRAAPPRNFWDPGACTARTTQKKTNKN